MKRKLLILFTIMLMAASGCSVQKSSKNVSENKNSKVKIYASIYPLSYLTKEIGKDKVDLHTIVPAGVEVHDYELSLRQTGKIGESDLFIFNGAGMESWGEKTANNVKDKGVKTINASEYVDLLDSKEEENHKHENDEKHNHKDGHSHDGVDPHIWLNPLNMNEIGKQIKEALISIDKKNKDFYEKNYKELSEKLKGLDEKYNNTLKDKKKDTILVSHSAFGYLVNRYNIKQISVTGITPYAEPSPKTLANLIDIAKKEDIEYIFLEVLANPKSVEMISKEANLKVLTLNPIEGLTKEQEKKGIDYIDIMEENLNNLKKVLVD
ncbi:ABC transporter zinc-binding lipoprotein ZnuA [Gottschalkia purinilytica]|uniref:ABC transporter zinc-binding lipoprotein ZnuA n=1 Tax=Gottschalkia purinilytica TaxID=1503 RepID=A0A0L0WDP3_GOTPU|nr:zinc ABC transporter substrate-binding protein [Gottschalkia purinilytica]KNF09535.1 ABC transporter zinc-binding lipoprotein ZnuA [Gottschalkia purinilytica]